MTLRPLDWLAWFFVMLVVAGFMMPWFQWQPPERAASPDRAAAVVERLAAESEQGWFTDYFGLTWPQLEAGLTLMPEGVAGYALPFAFAPENSAASERLRRSEVLGEHRQGDRAWFAYAVPLMAIFAALFVSFVPQRWALFFPLVGCALIYAGIRYTLAVGYYDRTAVGVEIGPGLWLGAYGLLALWAVVLVRLFLPENSRL